MLKKTVSTVLIAAAAVGFTGIAVAQDGAAANSNGTPAAQSQTQTEMNTLIKQLRQKSATLDTAYKQALETNADLREQQDQFVAMMRQAIQDQGYDLDAGQQRLQDMAKQMKTGDLSDDERTALLQKFTTERQSLNQARTAALQQPEIKQAGQSLQTATVAAMTAQNPEVEQLLQDIAKLRQQIRTAAQAASAG